MHDICFINPPFCVGSCYQTETAIQWVCGTGSWWVALTLRYSQLVHSTLSNMILSKQKNGWRFVKNSRANIQVTIDCSAVLPFVLGVVTRQKPQFNGSVVLGADESPWPCGTPSWYTPPYRIWFWVSRRIFIYSHHNTFVLFSKMYVRLSVCLWTESCLLCIFNNTRRIHFIFAYLIKQLQKVCCV